MCRYIYISGDMRMHICVFGYMEQNINVYKYITIKQSLHIVCFYLIS